MVKNQNKTIMQEDTKIPVQTITWVSKNSVVPGSIHRRGGSIIRRRGSGQGRVDRFVAVNPLQLQLIVADP